MNQLLHNIGSYHVETRPLVCRENQWTGFYMTEIFVMKELMVVTKFKLKKNST